MSEEKKKLGAWEVTTAASVIVTLATGIPTIFEMLGFSLNAFWSAIVFNSWWLFPLATFIFGGCAGYKLNQRIMSKAIKAKEEELAKEQEKTAEAKAHVKALEKEKTTYSSKLDAIANEEAHEQRRIQELRGIILKLPDKQKKMLKQAIDNNSLILDSSDSTDAEALHCLGLLASLRPPSLYKTAWAPTKDALCIMQTLDEESYNEFKHAVDHQTEIETQEFLDRQLRKFKTLSLNEKYLICHIWKEGSYSCDELYLRDNRLYNDFVQTVDIDHFRVKCTIKPEYEKLFETRSEECFGELEHDLQD